MNRKKPRRRHAALVRHNRKQQVAVASPPTAPTSESERSLSMVLAAARDKTIDANKMRVLIALRREMEIERDIRDLDAAMRRVSAQARVVIKDRDVEGKYKYATLRAVDAVLRPLYSGEGLHISYNEVDSTKPEHKRVICRVSLGLAHVDTGVDIAVSTKGPKGGDVMTLTHAGGSALTYGRRYALMYAFNVITSDRGDDDGAAAGRSFNAVIEREEGVMVLEMLKESGRDADKFYDWLRTLCGATTVFEIPRDRYAQVIKQIGVAEGMAKAAVKQERASEHSNP